MAGFLGAVALPTRGRSITTGEVTREKSQVTSGPLKAPNSDLNQKAIDDFYNSGTLPGVHSRGIGTPREMPASPNPSATAEDFALRMLGRQPTDVEYARSATMNKGNCPGCWIATKDGVTVTFRPAGSASEATLTTTATVQVNFSKVDTQINNGKALKLKFPK
jgi:filamentous hemagglutinin